MRNNLKKVLLLTVVFALIGCIPSAQRKFEEKIYEATKYSTYLTYYLMKDFIQRGDFSSAVNVYENFNGPKNNYIRFLYAFSLMKVGKNLQAAKIFRDLSSKKFFLDYTMYFAGLNYYKNGNFNLSKKLLEQHLKQFPTSIFTQEDRCILTKITLKLGIDRVYEGDFPDSADCLFTLIQSKNKRGEPTKKLVRSFIVKYPAHSYESDLLKIAQTSLFNLLSISQLKARWNSLISKGKIKLVKKETWLFSKLNRDYGCYYYYLGMIRFRQKNYSAAIKYFKRARRTRHNPCAQETLYNLGRSYARIGNNKESMKIFKTLLLKFPRSSLREETIYRIALVYSYMKDTESTISSFKKYLNEFPNGKYTNVAHWEIAYESYGQGNTVEAFTNLKALLTSQDYFEKAKALYWLAKWENNEQYFKTLFRNYPLNYYTYIASRCTHFVPGSWDATITYYASTITTFPKPTSITTTHMYNIKELVNLGLKKYIYSEAERALEFSKHQETDAYIIGKWLSENKLYYNSIKIIVNNFPDEILLVHKTQPVYIDLLQIIFPPAFSDIVKQWAEAFKVKSQWIWAVMRQESRFNPHIVSIAGAKGLLQVIDPTARKMLRIMGENQYNYNLFNPDDNIKIGTFYLKFLFKKFNDDPVLALAAYNAGENNVEKWVKTNSYSCIDQFVEEIPYQETRKYVKKVISNWMVYNFLQRLPEYEAFKDF